MIYAADVRHEASLHVAGLGPVGNNAPQHGVRGQFHECFIFGELFFFLVLIEITLPISDLLAIPNRKRELRYTNTYSLSSDSTH